MTYRLVSLATVVLLAACQTTTDAPAPAAPPAPAVQTDADLQLKGRLAGKTLSNDTSTLAVAADGTLLGKEASGEIVRGAWTVRDGKFCRTLTEPAAFAGTQCQTVIFSGNQATFMREDGSAFTYTVS